MSDPDTSAAPAGDESTVEPVDQDAVLSYEDARDQLMEVVQALESGGTTLEESLALWERGERLAQVCQSWLDGARARLERATGTD